MHVYLDEPSWQRLERDCMLAVQDPYEYGTTPYPMMAMLAARKVSPLQRLSMFDRALMLFVEMVEGAQGSGALFTLDLFDGDAFNTMPYFKDVAAPMYNSFMCYKRREWDSAQAWLAQCKAQDWAQASANWLNRRLSAATV